MVASLSLGAGVMVIILYFESIFSNKHHIVNFLKLSKFNIQLYSSLYTLLHEAKESFSRSPKSKEHAGIYLIAFYFLGVIGSAVINKLIHHFTFEKYEKTFQMATKAGSR